MTPGAKSRMCVGSRSDGMFRRNSGGSTVGAAELVGSMATGLDRTRTVSSSAYRLSKDRLVLVDRDRHEEDVELSELVVLHAVDPLR